MRFPDSGTQLTVINQPIGMLFGHLDGIPESLVRHETPDMAHAREHKQAEFALAGLAPQMIEHGARIRT